MPSPAFQHLELPDVAGVSGLGDDELLALQARLAGVRRAIDVASATVAAEVGRRSARELGFAGLAQRSGARTPERLIASVSGLSVPESRAMLAAGDVLGGGEEWLAPVATALQAGDLSVAATSAIRDGLGRPGAEVGPAELERAAERVAEQARGLPPEKAAVLARQVRDALDEAGIADRAARQRARRSLRIHRLPDGMTRLVAILDPENAALVTDAIDRITAPRRGGVRFVDPAEQERAAAIVGDDRSTEQLALDALVQMIRMAGAVDDGTVFGVRGPEVRLHITADDLERGAGRAWIEGQDSLVDARVAQRLICTVGVLPILFDDRGEPLRLGRSQRLHSKAQRTAMAARDGGCLAPGCERPPSWCEAHHVDEWEAHSGRTDADTGVLLCAHHHRWVHDTGARIRRVARPARGSTFELVTHDGEAIPLRSRSALQPAA